MVCMCSLFRHAAFKTLGSRKQFSPYIDGGGRGRHTRTRTDAWEFRILVKLCRATQIFKIKRVLTWRSNGPEEALTSIQE